MESRKVALGCVRISVCWRENIPFRMCCAVESLAGVPQRGGLLGQVGQGVRCLLWNLPGQQALLGSARRHTDRWQAGGENSYRLGPACTDVI